MIWNAKDTKIENTAAVKIETTYRERTPPRQSQVRKKKYTPSDAASESRRAYEQTCYDMVQQPLGPCADPLFCG